MKFNKIASPYYNNILSNLPKLYEAKTIKEYNKIVGDIIMIDSAILESMIEVDRTNLDQARKNLFS